MGLDLLEKLSNVIAFVTALRLSCSFCWCRRGLLSCPCCWHSWPSLPPAKKIAFSLSFPHQWHQHKAYANAEYNFRPKLIPEAVCYLKSLLSEIDFPYFSLKKLFHTIFLTNNISTRLSKMQNLVLDQNWFLKHPAISKHSYLKLTFHISSQK